MKYTSIIEKLEYLVELIGSSYIYLIFLGIMFIWLLLFIFKKISKANFVVMFIVLYISLFVTVIFGVNGGMDKLFNNIVNNFFTNIYFPSIYFYSFILLFVDVITIISVFNIRGNKIYKVINVICFSLIQFLFVIVIDYIYNNDIDVFSKISLFKSNTLVALLELSVNIFVFWLIIVIGIYIVNVITDRIVAFESDRVLSKKEVIIDNPQLEVSYEEDKEIDKEIDKEVNVVDSASEFNLNDFIRKSESIDVVDNNLVREEVFSKVEDSSNNTVDMLLNNNIPVIREDNNEKNINNYTLNDYKTFNKILKEIKMYNVGGIVNIDGYLEMRILDKFSLEDYNLFKKMLKNYSN